MRIRKKTKFRQVCKVLFFIENLFRLSGPAYISLLMGVHNTFNGWCSFFNPSAFDPPILLLIKIIDMLIMEKEITEFILGCEEIKR